MTLTSETTPKPPTDHSVFDRLFRFAHRIRTRASGVVASPRRKTLHHELAWWPVVASLVIMVLGFVTTSSWLAYQSIRDRKELLVTFAQFARNDLETSLGQVFADVQGIAVRWETVWGLTNDNGTRKALSRILEPVIVQRTARYDLVLFLENTGKIFQAVSGKANKPESLDGLEGRHYTTVLGASPAKAVLDDVLNKGKITGISVRQFPEVNRILGRRAAPQTKEELSTWYQFVVAVPVIGHAEPGGEPRGPFGAVVAVVSWHPFQEILDEMERKSARLGLDTGYAYLMNSDGNTVIGHKLRDPRALNLYGTRVEEDHHLPELRRLLRDSPGVVYPYWFRGVRKYAALQRISPPTPDLDAALGWRLGVGVDLPDILWAAVPSASLVFVAGLFVTLSVYVTAHVIASRASLSVQKLTQLVNAASKGEFTIVGAAASHEELSELHDAIGRLIVALRAEVGFAPLPNPYIVGTPIRTSHMFFGRESDLAWIAEHLRTPGNELILLTGQRRIGKTSLLHSIRRTDDTMGVLSFFFDTQMLMQDVVDDASFFKVLVSSLADQLAQRHPDIRPPELSRYVGQAVAVRKFLKYVVSQLNVTPVLLFDELENLQYKIQHDLLSPNAFNFFAALLDNDLPFSMVVTGSDDDRRRPRGPLRALLVKAISKRLSVLAPEEAREILLNPLKGRLDYENETVERILRFTGSHPYYTQDFCHRMVSALNQIRQVRVTHSVVNDVINRILDNPPPQLDYGWEQLPELARVLLCGMAATIANAAEFVDVQNAINALPSDYQEGLPPKRHRIHNVLITLLHRDWLEQKDHGYRFKVDLYRLWVKREHPPTQLAAFNWDSISKTSYAEQSVS